MTLLSADLQACGRGQHGRYPSCVLTEELNRDVDAQVRGDHLEVHFAANLGSGVTQFQVLVDDRGDRVWVVETLAEAVQADRESLID